MTIIKKHSIKLLLIFSFILISTLVSSATVSAANKYFYWFEKPGTARQEMGFETKEECEIDLALKTTDGGWKTSEFCFDRNNNIISVTPKSTEGSDPANTTYRLLAPIGELKEAPENFGDYLNKIFLIAIGLCAAIAFVMLVIAGIQYMGEESIFGKVNAKGQMENALIGLFIALSAYALLNTINADLLGTKGLKVKAAYIEIDESVHGDTPHSPTNGKYCGGKYDAFTNGVKTPWFDDKEERAEVAKAGITVKNKNCSYIGERNCTSLYQLDTSKVIKLKEACGSSCEVVITGGTECWLHSPKTTHVPGGNIVDLRISGLQNYIEKGNQKVEYLKKWNGESNVPVFTKNNAVFIKEKTHYHVKQW